MSDLIEISKRYETLRRAIEVLKKQLENGACEYLAGTLCLNTPDLIKDKTYLSADVKPLEHIICLQEREFQYLVSLMYQKHKGPTFAFYSQAGENIAEYEAHEAEEMA